MLALLASVAGPLVSDLIGSHHVAAVKAAPTAGNIIGALGGLGSRFVLGIAAGVCGTLYATNGGVRAGLDSAIAAAGRAIVGG